MNPTYGTAGTKHLQFCLIPALQGNGKHLDPVGRMVRQVRTGGRTVTEEPGDDSMATKVSRARTFNQRHRQSLGSQAGTGLIYSPLRWIRREPRIGAGLASGHPFIRAYMRPVPAQSNAQGMHRERPSPP
jgi:hypothetical protein